jgi:phosphate transport system substrate-binding protein
MKRYGAGVTLMAAAVLVAVVTGCGRGPAAGGPAGGQAKGAISQVGSTTLLPVAEKWRVAYNQEHPGVEIAVAGGGSGTGIKALIGGSADIADSSRAIEPAEVEQAKAAGVEPVEHVVAYDGIAVIVNPANPLTQISVEELSAIYSGLVTDWSAVRAKGLGPIQVVSRDSASGTYESFKELVVTLGGKDTSRDYTAAALKQTSNQAVLTLVGQTKTAIGYVGLGYVDGSVKALAVVPLGGTAAVMPTAADVMNGSYPISRALYCYTNGQPTGELKSYLDWIQGPPGQAVVRELGLVPVKEESK